MTDTNRPLRHLAALVSLGLCAGTASAQTPCIQQLRLESGLYLLAASWPERATAVCFESPTDGQEFCVDEPITLTAGQEFTVGSETFRADLTCVGEPWQGEELAYVALNLSPGVRWSWHAYATNDEARGENSAQTAVIDLRAPDAPVILMLVQTLVDQAQAPADTAESLRHAVENQP